MAYQEYALSPKVDCLRYTRTYPCCADVPYTQLWIIIYVSRQSGYFLMLLEIPAIVVTLLSFGQFWLDATKAQSRIPLGATMFLSLFIMLNVASGILPRCGETLWIHYLILLNLVFTAAALVQSVCVVDVAFGGVGKVREAEAEGIDYYCKRIFPTLFFAILGIIYGVKPQDGYDIKSDNGVVGVADVLNAQPMYQGFAPTHHYNVGQVVAAPLVGVIALAAMLLGPRLM